MSDHQIGLKMAEREDLEFFLDAYEVSLGERLLRPRSSERPDFLCEQSAGRVVGVELTKVVRDPESAFYDRVVRHRDFMEPYEALDTIYGTILRKEAKRCSGSWSHPDSTILVLQLCDCPLSEMLWLLEDIGPDEFTGHGFKEIYLADYSELDAYQQIELFRLYPDDNWGYYWRERGKPYG